MHIFGLAVVVLSTSYSVCNNIIIRKTEFKCDGGKQNNSNLQSIKASLKCMFHESIMHIK